MRHRIVVAAMASVLSLSFAGSVQAAPLALFHNASNSKPATAKLVRFSLRNDSKTTVVLQCGDQQFTIEPGKTAQMKLATGSKIVAVNATNNQPAGSVVAMVGSELQGNTLVIS